MSAPHHGLAAAAASGDPRADDERAVVLLEMSAGDALIYAPGIGRADVGRRSTSSSRPSPATPSPSSPTRPASAPASGRGTRPGAPTGSGPKCGRSASEFWPVLLAALIVNLLALAVPLFTMNVYDRVIPNKAVPTLWVLAIGVCLALAFDFTLRLARSQLVDEIGRKLDAKYSPEAVREGDEPADGRRARAAPAPSPSGVSEYERVRDFFASTSVVLLVDIGFLLLFLVLIAVIAGWLVFVPIVGIAAMLAAGLILQKGDGRRGDRRPGRSASSIRSWSNRSAASRR